MMDIHSFNFKLLLMFWEPCPVPRSKAQDAFESSVSLFYIHWTDFTKTQLGNFLGIFLSHLQTITKMTLVPCSGNT